MIKCATLKYVYLNMLAALLAIFSSWYEVTYEVFMPLVPKSKTWKEQKREFDTYSKYANIGSVDYTCLCFLKLLTHTNFLMLHRNLNRNLCSRWDSVTIEMDRDGEVKAKWSLLIEQICERLTSESFNRLGIFTTGWPTRTGGKQLCFYLFLPIHHAFCLALQLKL